MAVTMSPSPANRLQSAANILFDYDRRETLAVRAGRAEQSTDLSKLGCFFRFGQLSRRNDSTTYVAAER